VCPNVGERTSIGDTINTADQRTRSQGLRFFTGEFHDAALEARFWDERAGEQARWASTAALFAGFLCLVLTATDLANMGFGPRYAAVFLVRLASAAPALILAVALRRDPELIKRHDIVTAVEAALLLGCGLVALLQPDPAGLANMEMGLLIFALFVIVPNRIEHVAGLTTGTAVIWVVATSVSRHLAAGSVAGTAMSFAAAIAIGLVAANLIGATRRREFASALASKLVTGRLRAEIAQREHAELELVHRANTDPLTKVGNRRHFEEQAQAEFRRSQRSHEPLSLMILDVDHFKWINDTHGHPVGDDVLRQLSAMLDEQVRRVDSVGRLGGEEFAVLMPGADRAQAEEAAERLRDHVSTLALDLPSGIVRLTVSIGVTECDVWTEDLADGLARADEALYRAKAAGRDRVVMA
jgi:diguanylate cyclase (GGDEF)-like protein